LGRIATVAKMKEEDFGASIAVSPDDAYVLFYGE